MKFQAGFCPNEAQTLLSLCTYSTLTDENHNYVRHEKIRKDWESITASSSKDGKLRFEIGKSSEGPYYLVFQTEDYTMQNIQRDLEIVISPATRFATNPEARIQKSFQELFKTICPELKPWMEIITESKHLDLYISGHGRAAAVATLCAAWLKQQTSFSHAPRIKAYLFGSPRVGNTFFTQELNEIYGARTWCYNVRHSQDLIPFIPLTPLLNARQTKPLLSFKDVGNLVLLKGDTSLHGTTLMGTFSKHRAQWYAHYLRQQFKSTKRLG